jgi:hypothetical protein
MNLEGLNAKRAWCKRATTDAIKGQQQSMLRLRPPTSVIGQGMKLILDDWETACSEELLLRSCIAEAFEVTL